MKIKIKKKLREIRFWLFYSYLKTIHNRFYYKRTYFLDKQNIPAKGQPLLIVCNHQNAINDALAIEFGFTNRIVSIFSRGDIFNNKFIAKFLKFLYILPAYRLNIDGEDSLIKNFDSFEEAHERLLSGGSVAIFPEGTNQDKHWLGDFSLAYLRMAFGAAERTNFEKDILVLPIANHYSDYFLIREEVLLQSGTPISLKPYYELYKTKPRTAQREVNKKVYQQISDLMLNVSDVENYEAIDYLRNTYRKQYAKNHQLLCKNLPQQFKIDKEFVAKLENLKKNNENIINNLYEQTLQLKQETLSHKVRDWNFEKSFSSIKFLLQMLAFIVLFPLFVIALFPNIVFFYAPKNMVKKFKEKGGHMALFAGGIQFALNSLVVLPIAYGIVFIVDFLFVNWYFAIIHFFLLPILGIFAWHYRLLFIKWKSQWRFHVWTTKEDFQKTKQKRDEIRKQLDELLK